MITFLDIEVFIKAIVVGFLSSIPLGPIGVICIQRTLAKGKISGFVSGLGAAVVDTFMAIAAGFSLVYIIGFIEDNKVLFKFFGGIIVIIIGIQIFFKNPIRQYRERRLGKNTMVRDFLSTMILTISNPLAIFLFIYIFSSLQLINNTYFNSLFVFSGIFIGAALWWFLLSSFVEKYRDKFRLKNLWWLNKITGVIIVLFGIGAFISILFS